MPVVQCPYNLYFLHVGPIFDLPGENCVCMYICKCDISSTDTAAPTPCLRYEVLIYVLYAKMSLFLYLLVFCKQIGH